MTTISHFLAEQQLSLLNGLGKEEGDKWLKLGYILYQNVGQRTVYHMPSKAIEEGDIANFLPKYERKFNAMRIGMISSCIHAISMALFHRLFGSVSPISVDVKL